MTPARRRHLAPTVVLAALLAACGSAPPRPAGTAEAAAVSVSTEAAPDRRPAAPSAATAPPPATPAAAAQPAPPVIAENAVFFAPGATRVDAAGDARLRAHAARLKGNPKLDVTLVGHTDNLGSTAYNLAIAEQRAAAVARTLQAMGVGRLQIRHYGMGDEQAAANCRNAACRQQQRRVDLIYSE